MTKPVRVLVRLNGSDRQRVKCPPANLPAVVHAQIRRNIARPLRIEHAAGNRLAVHFHHIPAHARTLEHAVSDFVLMLWKLDHVAVAGDAHRMPMGFNGQRLLRDDMLMRDAVYMLHAVNMVKAMRMTERVAVPRGKRMRMGHAMRMLLHAVTVAADIVVVIHPVAVLFDTVIVAVDRVTVLGAEGMIMRHVVIMRVHRMAVASLTVRAGRPRTRRFLC